MEHRVRYNGIGSFRNFEFFRGVLKVKVNNLAYRGHSLFNCWSIGKILSLFLKSGRRSRVFSEGLFFDTPVLLTAGRIVISTYNSNWEAALTVSQCV